MKFNASNQRPSLSRVRLHLLVMWQVNIASV